MEVPHPSHPIVPLRRTLLPVLGILLVGCTQETADPIQGPDTSDAVAPRAVSDLRLDSRTDEWISLSWTSPGDDGDRGQAWRYDVRRDTEPITESSWEQATQINGEPTPFVPGRRQVFTMVETDVRSTFYFVVRTLDDNGNLSSLSNVLEVMSPSMADEIPPGRISDLRVGEVGRSSVELRWTATGDDDVAGTATGYEIRYHRVLLSESNFREGTLLSETPVPTASGTEQVWIVNQLGPGTQYYFGLRAWDDGANRGPVSNIVEATTRAGVGLID